MNSKGYGRKLPWLKYVCNSNLRGRYHLGCVGVDGRIISKWILKK
jgi:hypothetical protein